MKKLKVTYVGDGEYQINVELPCEILQSYSKEGIAMALMCTVDNWVNGRMDDINEKKRLFSAKTIR